MEDKEYFVDIKEIHVQRIKVMASSQEEAMEKARKGDGQYYDMEYSHTLDKDTWFVEEVKSK